MFMFHTTTPVFLSHELKPKRLQLSVHLLLPAVAATLKPRTPGERTHTSQYWAAALCIHVKRVLIALAMDFSQPIADLDSSAVGASSLLRLFILYSYASLRRTVCQEEQDHVFKSCWSHSLGELTAKAWSTGSTSPQRPRPEPTGLYPGQGSVLGSGFCWGSVRVRVLCWGQGTVLGSGFC